MGSKPRAGGRTIVPIGTDGVEITTGKGQGVYTLSASTTYYYVLGGEGAPFESIHITGYTSGAKITSATIQDCDHGEKIVLDKSSTAGEWIPNTPPDAYVPTTGTGWSMVSAGVVQALGTGLGGARFNITGTGAARTRLEVVMGNVAGDFLVSGHGKE